MSRTGTGAAGEGMATRGHSCGIRAAPYPCRTAALASTACRWSWRGSAGLDSEPAAGIGSGRSALDGRPSPSRIWPPGWAASVPPSGGAVRHSERPQSLAGRCFRGPPTITQHPCGENCKSPSPLRHSRRKGVRRGRYRPEFGRRPAERRRIRARSAATTGRVRLMGAPGGVAGMGTGTPQHPHGLRHAQDRMDRAGGASGLALRSTHGANPTHTQRLSSTRSPTGWPRWRPRRVTTG